MLPDSDVNFEQMIAHHGEVAAYGYLEQIERAAGISPQRMTGVAPEQRLANAIRIQDRNNMSSHSIAA